MNHPLRHAATWGIAAAVLTALAGSARAQGVGVDTFEKMRVSTPEMRKRGGEIYKSQCAGCHGPQGRGKVDYPAERFEHPPPDFTKGKYRHGGGPIQVYNVVTRGLKKGYHPSYTGALRYQERWAVTHYVRSLGPTEGLTDPPKVVQRARERAAKGTCDPSIKKTISSKVEPKGKKQLQKGKKLYESNCATCHGKTGKGDGPAGKALNPAPRNFHDPEAKWTNGTSPLNIFNTLTNGIEGTSMAAFKSQLSEEERWALTHWVRQWIPKSKRQESTESDIVAVCRSLSQPRPVEPISVDRAEKALIDDRSEQRFIELQQYGPVRLSADADAGRGEEIYQSNCAQCHGRHFQGNALGPYGTRFERRAGKANRTVNLNIDVRPLKKGHAGGRPSDFANRSSAGVHATLPDMTSAGTLTRQQWEDLQAYVATAEGDTPVEQLPEEQTKSDDGSGENTKDGGSTKNSPASGDASQ